MDSWMADATRLSTQDAGISTNRGWRRPNLPFLVLPGQESKIRLGLVSLGQLIWLLPPCLDPGRLTSWATLWAAPRTAFHWKLVDGLPRPLWDTQGLRPSSRGAEVLW